MRTFIIVFMLACAAAFAGTTIGQFNSPPADPVILKAVGIYLPASCSDSIVAPPGTGQTLSITKSTSGTACLYQVSGTGTGVGFNVKMKDYNGGQVQVGDSLRMTSCGYTACGTVYNLRTNQPIFPALSVSGDTVRISYTECILPLNGTSGTVRFEFVQ